MKTKLIISIIVFVMLFGTVVFASSSIFTDIKEDAWYKDAVTFVAEKGIMTGKEYKFRPDDYVTRAELASIITRIYEDIESEEDKILKIIPSLLDNTVVVLGNNTYGSGVILENNLILTANHAALTDKVSIVTYKNKKYEGTVIKRDAKNDLALIKFDGAEFSKIILAESTQAGQTILTIGSPCELNFSISKGIISHDVRMIKSNNNFTDYIQLNAAVNAGNSGGGVFDVDGNLVGIVVRGVSAGMGYAVPYYKIRNFLENVSIN
jgi:S1-C subfamily serine protease